MVLHLLCVDGDPSNAEGDEPTYRESGSGVPILAAIGGTVFIVACLAVLSHRMDAALRGKLKSDYGKVKCITETVFISLK